MVCLATGPEGAADMNAKDAKKLKFSELRAELESRNLEKSGSKTELVERLERALAVVVS